MNPPMRQCPSGTRPYMIRRGDNFYDIAQRYNTTVPAIVAANPGVDPERLEIGVRICVPLQRRAVPCPGGNFYTIRSGDTMYSIAERFNLSLDDLLEANPYADPENLQVGEVICIPLAVAPVRCPQGTRPYRVRRGDTFYSVARRLGVGLEELIDLNPGLDPDNILVGQIICVPR